MESKCEEFIEEQNAPTVCPECGGDGMHFTGGPFDVIEANIAQQEMSCPCGAHWFECFSYYGRTEHEA